MTQSFDPAKAHSTVSRMRNYVADAGFEGRVQWKKNYNSSVLIEQDTDEGKVTEAVCVLVGEVSQNKQYTDQLGNYNPQYNTLATAKYQLTLTAPMQEPFKKDFEQALENLDSLQKTIATGIDNRYLLVSAGAGQGKLDGVRLSAPIAEARTVHLEAGAILDSETASINVDVDQVPAYDKFKLTHKMTPLRVFGTDDEPVAPHMMTQVLRGALVEVYFAVKHYFISGSEKRYNSFGGRIEQIIVLRRAADETPSPFRQSGRKGPFRPQLMDIKPMALLTVESGATTAAAKVTKGTSMEEATDDGRKSNLAGAAEISDKDEGFDRSSVSDLSDLTAEEEIEEVAEVVPEVTAAQSDRSKRKSARGGRTGDKESKSEEKESKRRKVD